VLTRRTAHRTRFFSLRWAALLILGPLLGLIAEFVVLMVAADRAALVAFFAILTLPFLGMAAWVAGLTLRPVTLTRSALRIPNGFKTVVSDCMTRSGPFRDLPAVSPHWSCRNTRVPAWPTTWWHSGPRTGP